MEIEEQKTKTSKQIKTVYLVIGIIYSGIASLMLIMVLLQKLMMFAAGDPVNEWEEMNEMHNIYFIFSPMVIMLGIAYIRFGLSFSKTPKKPILTNKILRIISAIISISYSIVSFRFVLHDIPMFFSIFTFMTIISSAFGVFIVILVFNLPQFVITKSINKYYNY